MRPWKPRKAQGTAIRVRCCPESEQSGPCGTGWLAQRVLATLVEPWGQRQAEGTTQGMGGMVGCVEGS